MLSGLDSLRALRLASRTSLSSQARLQTRWRQPSARFMTKCRSRATLSQWARARTGAATTTTPILSCEAVTGSYRSTYTCLVVRRTLKHFHMASCFSRENSSHWDYRAVIIVRPAGLLSDFLMKADYEGRLGETFRRGSKVDAGDPAAPPLKLMMRPAARPTVLPRCAVLASAGSRSPALAQRGG
jgi:hypothetical protein